VTAPRLSVALAAAAAGGVLGALARYAITDAHPPGLGFPWAVFWINVAGCALLAWLPALELVRRTPWLGVFLGTGVLGGFTTMSAASEQTVYLFDHHRSGTAFGYLAGTLVAALSAAWLVSRFTSPDDRAVLERDEADE
jgi:CrcB protein